MIYLTISASSEVTHRQHLEEGLESTEIKETGVHIYGN